METEKNLDARSRTALWYAIEELFGGEMFDPYGEPYWSPELEMLEERIRKRLRRLSLDTAGNIPTLLQGFIIDTATTKELTALAEEALTIARQSGADAARVIALKDGIEQAFREGGIEFRFSADGRLVHDVDVDTSPRAVAVLPRQTNFKRDLKERCASQIAVVFVDLDNFKSVNDTRGHPAGDACLEQVVKLIGACIVGKGRLYRYGGDEFAVILQNANVLEGAATAERIRRSIEAGHPGGDIDVTASIGVASSDQVGNDAERLLEAADGAMYASKQAGKNQVTRWRSEGEV